MKNDWYIASGLLLYSMLFCWAIFHGSSLYNITRYLFNKYSTLKEPLKFAVFLCVMFLVCLLKPFTLMVAVMMQIIILAAFHNWYSDTGGDFSK